MKAISLLIISACIFIGVNAQTKKIIHPIKMGDKVPDIEFKNVLNHKSRKAKLSDFKGKLVILDIWSTWCTSCIGAFPEMDKLQKEFGNKIQILLVNPHGGQYDSEDKVKTVLTKLKARIGYYPSLPIPIGDTLLNSYFPHNSVPHEVWINEQGQLIGITLATDVTKENIQSILNKKFVSLPLKNDNEYDITKPLLIDGNGGDPGNFVYRSLFTKYLGGSFKSSTRYNDKHEVIGLSLLNYSLRQLVNSSYHEVTGVAENRAILNVNNPERFSMKFDPSNAYCYDLTIPPTPSNNFKASKYLKNDLKQAFNLSVYKEKKKIPALVISSRDDLSSLYTKYKKDTFDLDEGSIKKFMHHYAIADVIKFIDWYSSKPLIDETGISDQKIDIDFPDNFDLNNQQAVIDFLKSIGFEIKEEERELDVVVITDK